MPRALDAKLEAEDARREALREERAETERILDQEVVRDVGRQRLAVKRRRCRSVDRRRRRRSSRRARLVRIGLGHRRRRRRRSSSRRSSRLAGDRRGRRSARSEFDEREARHLQQNARLGLRATHNCASETKLPNGPNRTGVKKIGHSSSSTHLPTAVADNSSSPVSLARCGGSHRQQHSVSERRTTNDEKHKRRRDWSRGPKPTCLAGRLRSC